MKVIRSISEMRETIRQYRREHPSATVGLVPTMGYLHEGHGSLFRNARKDCGLVIISIFVNPLQFGPNEDFERYPRDEERDLLVARNAGVDIVFKPEADEMYPSRPLTKVSVDQITAGLCGASRPGHFDGVCTVVSKLFHIVQPDRAYFGMKDAQQVAVIMQMTIDLNIPVEIIPCETVREEDGLALSSRNVYLSEEERKQAIVLQRSLLAADEYIRNHPDGSFRELRELVVDILQSAPLAVIDYVELVRFPAMAVVEDETKIADALRSSDILAALAVKFGTTRLIDNRLWSGEGGEI